MLEDELGKIVGQPGPAGCSAVLAWMLETRSDPALLLHTLGTHHFLSYNLAKETCWVACELLSSSAEAVVPDVRDMLTANEYECLVAAVIEKVPGASGAFIAEQRKRQIPECVKTATLHEKSAFVDALYDLMLELAGNVFFSCKTPLCPLHFLTKTFVLGVSRFDQTGDTFLVLAIRAMMPAQAVSTLEDLETPYAISKTAIVDSNETIGALFRKPPAAVLKEHADDVMSATKLCLMMTIATEYLTHLKTPPLYINSDIGPANETSPAIFLCSDFNCGVNDTVVVVAPDCDAMSFNCVASAMLMWASLDPRAKDLYTAVTQPEMLDPNSVFRRINKDSN